MTTPADHRARRLIEHGPHETFDAICGLQVHDIGQQRRVRRVVHAGGDTAEQGREQQMPEREDPGHRRHPHRRERHPASRPIVISRCDTRSASTPPARDDTSMPTAVVAETSDTCAGPRRGR